MTITLNVTTNQEALDRVATHLSTLKGRSMIPGSADRCAYAGVDSEGQEATCAAGALLDATREEKITLDAQADSSFFGLSRFKIVDSGDVDPSLIREFQIIHDLAGNWDGDTFIGYFDLFLKAQEYGLDTTVLDRLVSQGGLNAR